MGIEEYANRMICTDALTLLRSLPSQSINAVITDPPYGLAKHNPLEISKRKRHGRGGAYKRVNEAWDQSTPLEWMDEINRILKPGGAVIVFNSNIGLIEIGYRGLQLGWRLLLEITWYKPDAPPNFTGRMVTAATEKFYWYCPSGSNWTYNRLYAKRVNNGKNFRDVWQFYAPRKNRVHPTQKPLELMDRIVRLFTNPGDVIVDPFAGSGTTLIAAKNAGRDYIGCDLEESYVSIALDRLASPSELPLFSETAVQQELFEK